MIPLFRVRMADDAGRKVSETLGSGYIGEGPKVQEFEAALRSRLQHPYVSVVNAGTSALDLAYHLVGIGPGDTVLSSPLTCLLTHMPLMHRGARITWVDVDPKTGGMDGQALLEAIQKRPKRTKAVVLCDWGGDVGDLLWIQEICHAHGLKLIQDAAHAFGATLADGGSICAAVDYTAFSFQAIKALTTGDGGALACRDAPDDARVRVLRWAGLDRTKRESMRCIQQVPEPGFKYQMNDIAATIGLANLPGLDAALTRQRETSAYYDQCFAHDAVQPLTRTPGSSCWLYSVRVPHARDFITAMARRGIECSEVHVRNDTQRIFAAFRTPLPGMDVLAQELVCLPVGWWLTDEDRSQVANAALLVMQEAA